MTQKVGDSRARDTYKELSDYNMSDHIITWRFDPLMERVMGQAECRAPEDAFCRTIPDPKANCTCEEWESEDRDEKGWYHVIRDVDDNKIVHRHVGGEDCNICLFLNDDPTVTIDESYNGTASVLIGSTEIATEWDGVTFTWGVA